MVKVESERARGKGGECIGEKGVLESELEERKVRRGYEGGGWPRSQEGVGKFRVEEWRGAG